MEKKYQVFISSTYEDLKDERLGVIASLLTANCIPVGMEQFTASLNYRNFTQPVKNLACHYSWTEQEWDMD